MTRLSPPGCLGCGAFPVRGCHVHDLNAATADGKFLTQFPSAWASADEVSLSTPFPVGPALWDGQWKRIDR